MLRDVAELAGAAEPLLLRLREAFVELIFSAEPYDGASLELRVPWFEVASRRASEKFALKTKEDQLLADLQHLREELEKAQGTASNAVRERARMASVCREREEEAKRSTSTLQVVEKNQLETTRATAVVVASLERRLESTCEELTALKAQCSEYDADEARQLNKVRLAAKQAARGFSQKSTTAEELDTLQEQLRALRLAALSEPYGVSVSHTIFHLNQELALVRDV
ncbi:MAG: hypothetical protein SGPRY_007899 [Prymnesium sp.]